jgi:hypothetical protein
LRSLEERIIVRMEKDLSTRVFGECRGWLTEIRELPHGGSGADQGQTLDIGVALAVIELHIATI